MVLLKCGKPACRLWSDIAHHDGFVQESQVGLLFSALSKIQHKTKNLPIFIDFRYRIYKKAFLSTDIYRTSGVCFGFD